MQLFNSFVCILSWKMETESLMSSSCLRRSISFCRLTKTLSTCWIMNAAVVRCRIHVCDQSHCSIWAGSEQRSLIWWMVYAAISPRSWLQNISLLSVPNCWLQPLLVPLRWSGQLLLIQACQPFRVYFEKRLPSGLITCSSSMSINLFRSTFGLNHKLWTCSNA